VTRVVIDTNVLKAANGESDQADSDCADSAAKALEEAIRSKIMVIDSAHFVIDEYKKHCTYAGQPGAGNLFFKVLTDNIANPSRVLTVDIGSTQEEIALLVPDNLLDFDNDDHKWIALHLEGEAESIINAVDSDWEARKSDLVASGVNVIELCPWCLSEEKSRPMK
jgi:predicted nucleic acid-binding protein